MKPFNRLCLAWCLGVVLIFGNLQVTAQNLPPKYLTLELFTNTPCPICGSQNPGLFNRLANYEGQYHLISFHPGKPYSSCVFYQANIPENTARYQFYTGHIFGSPTVALNGTDFKSSSGVTNTVLDGLTGGTSWLHVGVTETEGTSRNVDIALEDIVGGSLASGRLFAVIVEKQISYSAPNGETIHRNVFRKFLTPTSGDVVDLSSGSASRSYAYEVDGNWDPQETYVIAWLADPTTNEIYNSGTRFDPDFVSAVSPVVAEAPLLVFPNPSTTVARIMIPADVTSADLQVFDQRGQLLYAAKDQTGPEVHIATDHFPQGHYIIRLITSQKVFAGTFDVVK